MHALRAGLKHSWVHHLRGAQAGGPQLPEHRNKLQRPHSALPVVNELACPCTAAIGQSAEPLRARPNCGPVGKSVAGCRWELGRRSDSGTCCSAEFLSRSTRTSRFVPGRPLGTAFAASVVNLWTQPSCSAARASSQHLFFGSAHCSSPWRPAFVGGCSASPRQRQRCCKRHAARLAAPSPFSSST